MEKIDTELLLIVLCSLVVVSYFFSIISKVIKVPSVLLLLFAGIGFKVIADYNNFNFILPDNLVEGLGVVGLIMIILEAGLDLKLSKDKVKLIQHSLMAALFILLLSIGFIAGILYEWSHERLIKCMVYAVPLSIMSSSIVIPSITHLAESKKEFLVYEASFSDIIGVMFFNYLTAGEVFSVKAAGAFGISLIVSILLSVIISFALLFLLTKTKLNIKFFLVFSILVVIYSGGKLLHLPSLLIILAFGLLINNWEKIPIHHFAKFISDKEVIALRSFLHSITAETSFLVRTFFFILFGFSIDLKSIAGSHTFLIGGAIVLVLFLLRFFYFRFYFKTKGIREAFFIPRGLVTIVLFYKIPVSYKLATFNNGILFFIILTTGILLTIGMITYKTVDTDTAVEDPIFAEPNTIA